MKVFKHQLKSVADIFSPDIVIPPFQRAYSWNPQEYAFKFAKDLVDYFKDTFKSSSDKPQEHFTKTLKDNIINKKNIFYIGQIVLSANEVVDGQQRLTTISIILKALSDFYYERFEKSMNDIDLFFRSMRGGAKISSSKVDEKWSKYFQNYKTTIRSIESSLTDKSEKKNFKKSLFYKNYDAIYDLIKIEAPKKSASLEFFLVNFLEFIKNAVHSLVVEIDSSEDALQFFDVMNSRSLPLTPADLIKNSFLKDISNQGDDVNVAARTWDTIMEEIQGDVTDLTRYIRYIFISNVENVTERKLADAIRLHKSDFNVVAAMQNYLNAYKRMNLMAGSNTLLIDAQINFITKIGASASLSPVILEILSTHSHDTKAIHRLLDELVAFSFKFFKKYSFKANAYATKITEICSNIRNKSDNPLGMLWDAYGSELSSLGDEGDFAEYDIEWFRGNKDDSISVIRFARALFPLYIMKKFDENHALYDSSEYTSYISLNLDSLDIEHIYPKDSSEDEDWEKLKNEDTIWWLGNLLLVSASKNRSAKNFAFSKKYDYYMGAIDGVDGERRPGGRHRDQQSLLFERLVIDVMDKNSLPITKNTVWNQELIEKRTNALFEEIKKIDLFGIKKFIVH